MKDEIKEILDKLKKLCYDDYCLEFSVDYIERKEEKLLLDYITNLQEDLEKANSIIEEDRKFNNGRLLELADYKSRNKKAIECIKNFLCTEEYIKVDGIAISDNYLELLNILGGNNE